jgi:alkylated DNA repair dioxygenase AlkB
MFSGIDDSHINDPLPELFQPYYDFMISKDSRYNQVVINWYDPESSIPLHSDCAVGMVENYTISMLNINTPSEEIATNRTNRTFKLKSRKHHDNLYNKVEIILCNGILVTMGGNTQNCYTHGVSTGKQSRISFSCRQFK